MKSSSARRIALGGALVAALALPSSALALSSTTVYPAGDDATLASTGTFSITAVTNRQGWLLTCSLAGGMGTVPASNHNPAGPVSVDFSIQPSFSCTASTATATITVSGASLGLQYGPPSTGSITIPTGDLVVTTTPTGGGASCVGTSTSALSIPGTWSNGFALPTLLNSTLSAFGRTNSVNLTWTGSNPSTCTAGVGAAVVDGTAAVVSARDATNPSNVVLVGP